MPNRHRELVVADSGTEIAIFNLPIGANLKRLVMMTDASLNAANDWWGVVLSHDPVASLSPIAHGNFLYAGPAFSVSTNGGGLMRKYFVFELFDEIVSETGKIYMKNANYSGASAKFKAILYYQ